MKSETISTKKKIAASQSIKEKDYWLNQLSGHMVKSFFPYDHQGGAGDKLRLDTINFKISDEISAKLMKLSSKSDNRLHMIFTAGLTALLNKYTGNKDIIVGMPIYKQEVEGEFINTVLPLRNKLEVDMTFKRLILQVRAIIFEAAEYQNYPIETLLYKLNTPSSQTTGFALFDAAILLENIHEKRYLKHINYNILFSFLRTGESIKGSLEYNASLYEKATGERIVNHYQQLLTAALSNPNISLANIDILPKEEKQRILLDFNNTHQEYPQDKIIHALLETRVEKAADRIAVIYKDQYLTYGALNEKANRLAGLLREKGVKPDSIVGIIMEPSLELIIGIAGIIKAGGAYLPIEPEYPEKRILSILRDSGASILLTCENILKTTVFTSLKGFTESNVTPMVTSPRGQIKDFDSLPFPDRTIINYEKYHQYIGIALAKHTVSLQATRGCPYNCVYCHKIWPKRHVARSAENIFEEIKHCYHAGARRFTFIDDVFNLKKDNVARLMEKIIKNRFHIQLFFPNGLRGDILTRETIDLMVEAGTVNVDLALESASPRIQKLIRKNLDIEKFREIAQYFTEQYPRVILEMELMIGFPTETEEEALMTLDFLKSLKWVHFPNLNILKIYPNSDMYRLAVKHGISPEQIERSTSQAFHELPHTLPFSKSFAGQFQMRFMNEYFLSKERLQHVLPHQGKILTKDELVQKYDSYLPMNIRNVSDILNLGGISTGESDLEFLPKDHMAAPGFRENMRKYFPAADAEDQDSDALRILLLDLSLLFSSSSEKLLYNMVEEPLGLSYLLSYLKKTFGRKIHGKIGKSMADFDSFNQLKAFIRDFNPDLIGLRTLSYYKEFFHNCVTLMRQWGIDVPIIAGGPYATSDYRLVLNDPSIDIVVLGEGELTFSQLIEKIMENSKKLPDDDVLKTIPGISFVKKDDKILVKENTREIVFLDNIEETTAWYPGENPYHVNHPGDLLYLISTSGSTGIPKSLMIEHRNLANLLYFQLLDSPVDFQRVLQFASIGFDVASQEIFSTLLSGGELYLMDSDTKRDVYRMLQLMDRNHLDVIYWPPAFLKYVLSEPDHRALFPKSVRHIITAGEQLIITKPIRRYMQENHVYVHNHYGPAETHVVTTYIMEPNGDIPEMPPIGKPISNTRMYILDENKHPKPIGAIGELYIAGANVGRGYHRRNKLTSEKFMVNPFVQDEPMRMYRSGDLARWLPDGNIEFLDRADNQVKIRGFRVELAEIETQLMQIESIKQAVVVDHKDPAGEKFLCAYVVSENKSEIAEIKDVLSNDLPGYMIPSYFVTLDKIPLTPNGKIDRKALPNPEIKVEDDYVAPRNGIEEKLVEIWWDVLNIDREVIGVESNFFELGGHSLKATMMVAKIHRNFNIKVPLAEVFKRPNIRGLSLYIESVSPVPVDKYESIKPLEKRAYYGLSSAQKRLYILQQMEIASTGYNIPLVLPLEEGIEIERLEQVCIRLIFRYESLRTSFEMVQDEPVQRIHDEVSLSLDYYEAEVDGEDILDRFVRPFDLSKAPLVRVGVVQLKSSGKMLLFDLHHIITDGVSHEILTREFNSLYAGTELPNLRLQYRDYAVWQSSDEQRELIREQERYWLHLFSGELPLLNLPIDFSRPLVQSFEGARVSFILDESGVKRLKEISSELGSTLYMMILALFNILLSKLSGDEDIIVGTPIAGRRHPDLEKLIGMFVNTLAMRNSPTGSKSFKEFLKEVKERTLEAFENQEYQFEDLVDNLSLRRDIGRNPLFDVMFNLLNRDEYGGEVSWSEDSFDHRHRKGASKFDITLSVVDYGDRFYFVFAYCTKLFRAETIERFVFYFKKIISEIMKNVEIKLWEIEMISKEEKREILYDFNDTETGYPEDKTIHELFKDQVERTPEHIAVVFDDKKLTYRVLDERSNQLSRVLADKGVESNSIVGIMVERSIEMVIGILGILKSGGAYLPIDPDYPIERKKYMLVESGVEILLVNVKEHYIENFDHLFELIELDDSNLYVKEKRDSEKVTTSGSLAYVIYTSGSTGKPKGVMIEHASVINLAFSQMKAFKINEKDHILQFSSMSFDASVEQVFISLLSGSVLILIDKMNILDEAKFERFILNNMVTHLHAIPSFLENIRFKKYGNLKRVLSGGDVCSFDLALRWCGDYDFYNRYGPTETTVTSIEFLVNGNDDFQNRLPIGRPIDNTTVYILDNFLRCVPIGVYGEIYIGGDGLARGYLNNNELTEERFTIRPFVKGERLYKTGDLARRLPGGNIEFLGRIDQQVKLRGFRIELGEIESQLLKHNAINKVLVTSKENKGGEKYLCAYIIIDSSYKVPNKKDLREYLSKELPDYMIPSYFVTLDKIPLTPNGKIDRKALPNPEIKVEDDYTAPRNEIEEKLVEIWWEVLNVDKGVIGVDSNFFELGGHSLKATILVSKIHKELDAKVPLVEIFRAPTIRNLSEYIKGEVEDKYLLIEPVEKKEYYPQSSAQKRLYILQQFENAGIAYNMPYVIPLRNDIEIERIEAVLMELLSRHESLRTSFEMVGEEVFQRVHDEVDFEIEEWNLGKGVIYQVQEVEELPKKDKKTVRNQYKTQNLKLKTNSINEIIKCFVRPFELSRAPLLHVGLIKHSDGKNTLLVDLHHILTDGTSQVILVEEFKALLNGDRLSPLRLHYKDFSEWQNRKDQKETLSEQERYWLDLFSDEFPVLELPYDFSRPEVQSFEGSNVRFILDDKNAVQIRQIISETNVTLYMFLLSVFNILLSKLSGNEDIVIGTPIAARRHSDLERIIGMFVNTLGMRNNPVGNITFREFLSKVKNNILQAYDNQEYPFEELVDKLSLRRDMGRNPIFDVMLNLVNQADFRGDVSLDDDRDYEYVTSKFDLNLTAIDFGDKLYFNLEYCTKLFKKVTIEKFIGYFKKILDEVLCSLDIGLLEIDILTSEEKSEVLKLSGGDYEAINRTETIHMLFEKEVDKIPDNRALIFNRESLSYSELNRRSNQLARLLRQKGVGKDKIVGLMVERSFEMVVGILGILKAGGAYLPIDVSYPENRKVYMLEDGEVEILLMNVDDGENCGIQTSGIEIINISSPKLYQGKYGNLYHINTGNDLVYMIYTSGSTGIPKGIMLEHKSMVNLMKYQFKYMHVDFTRVLQFVSISFDVSFQEIFSTLLSGGSLYLISEELRSNIHDLLNYIGINKIEVLFLPTSFLRFLFGNEEYNTSLPKCVKHLITAGEQVVINERFRKYLNDNNIYLHNHYGPSETHVVTALTVDPAVDIPDLPTIGRPVLNTDIYILDKWNNLLPIGVAGELCVGGIQVGRGYYGKDKLTEEKFISNPFKKGTRIYKTGDLSRYQSNGEIEFLGRIDDQVKIRGYRVEPGEVESQLLNHEGVREAVVLVRDDVEDEKTLCAYVILNEEIEGKDLREYLLHNLPDYMIPSCFIHMDSFPLTPNGKIDRKALPNPEIKVEDDYTAPRDEIEEKLVEIWWDVLNIDREVIGVESNFFELGGHSLKATILSTKISKLFDIQFPLVEVFKSSTIRKMAEFIKIGKKDMVKIEDNLILLKRGNYKNNNLFFIHDGSGEVEGYIEFCNNLEDKLNYWGIKADRTAKLTPQNWTIQNIAKKYITKMKKIQQKGPYFIVGWSLGGTIAFEIVRQLEKMNLSVEFFGMIDSPPPDVNSRKYRIKFTLESELNWVRRFLHESKLVEKLKNSADINKLWKSIINYLIENDFESEIILKSMPEYLIQPIPDYKKLGIRDIIYYINVIRTFTNSRAFYIPKSKIKTQMHYFVASQSKGFNKISWSHFCTKPIRCYKIKGDHFSIFKQPDVIEFSNIFQEVINNEF